MFHVKPRRCSKDQRLRIWTPREPHVSRGTVGAMPRPSVRGSNALSRPTTGFRRPRRCATPVRHLVDGERIFLGDVTFSSWRPQGTPRSPSASSFSSMRATRCPTACATRRNRDTRDPPGTFASNRQHDTRGPGSAPALHDGRPQVWTVSPHRYAAWNHGDGARSAVGVGELAAASRCWPEVAQASRRRPRRAAVQRDRRLLLVFCARPAGVPGRERRGRAISWHRSVGENTSHASRRTAGDA
jgi:hypothetical protein